MLVLNEQGFGDEILFSRSFPGFSKAVKSAHVQVKPELLDFFNEHLKLENVTYFSAETLSKEFVDVFDCWSTTGTLWTLWNDPAYMLNNPYEKVDDIIRIGFVTSSNKISKNAKLRSIPATFFKKTLVRDGTELHNLAIDGEVYDFATDHRTEIKSFNDTLKLIQKMDIIITADTGVAHLAAISGVPTVVVYDKYLDWRWTNNFYNCKICHVSKFNIEDFLKEKTNG